jgi:nucleoside 2-deoxyribosyltransferase
MKYIYLASPYSHPDHQVREHRYRAACRKAAEYASKGIAIFAPIVHSHPLVPYMAAEDCMNFDLWMKLDLPLLKDADELHVLCIDGWRTSRGVTREIDFATELGIPVKQVFADIEP